MKSTLTTTILCVILVMSIGAQDCTFYYPQLEGTSLVYQHFDKKDKPSSKTSQQVISYSANGQQVTAEILMKSFDEKDELVFESELEVRCEAGVFYFDMENYLSPETMSAYQEMEMVIDASDLEIPSRLEVGEQLKDGSLKATVSSSGFPIMTISITISDRFVKARENITTPAGTFECWKIDQTVTTKAGLKFVMNTSEWLSEGIGMVKSVSLNQNGKLISSSELIEVKK